MSGRRIAVYAGVGILAYLLFLALTLPASALFRWLLPQNGAIAVVAPQGTPWHGEARQLTVDGAPLGRLGWQIHPWSLFAGRLDYDLHVHAAATQLDGEAVVKPGGEIALTGVSGFLDLAPVLAWLQLPGGSAVGRAQLNIDKLVVDGGRPTVMTGRITLDRLHLLWPKALPLGGYVATFKTDTKGIHGTARDTGGPIDLDATVNVDTNGRYRATGTLAARGNADPLLRQALQFLGTPDAGGATHFVFTGSLIL